MRKGEHTYNEQIIFACNLDINKAEDAKFREKIIYRSFEELGILN